MKSKDSVKSHPKNYRNLIALLPLPISNICQIPDFTEIPQPVAN